MEKKGTPSEKIGKQDIAGKLQHHAGHEGGIGSDRASIGEMEEDIIGSAEKGLAVKPDILREDHPDLAK